MKPRPYQLKAVEVAAKNPRAGLEMCTGSGKSYTMGLLIHKLQMRTLVIVPNLELKKQLSETFQEMFGSLNNISVENIDNPKLAKMTDYDVLIIDECHHASSSTYTKLNRTAWNGIYHRYFFSGTFYRNQANETLPFEAIVGPLCYQFTYKEAIEQGAIMPVEALYLHVPSKETDKNTWGGVYSDLVVNNGPRNQMIALMLLRLNSERKSTLCLVKEIAHGKILEEMTGIPFCNGADNASRVHLERFKNGEITALIATTGVAGEGTDTKPCEFVIISCLGKAKGAFLQQVGRAVRLYGEKESAKVILFQDKSHKFTRSHFKAQCDTLKETFGVKPVKVEL